ncbi:MAG TPA: PQQ-binding-like beta-propeller repeat protein, partial [Bryobacteraceae bacterium]|nr:PQQ-binding-like beta-propeller repeat protein [Bryobacteraceae bacterium]
MIVLLAFFFLLCLPAPAQEWPFFGGDAGGAKYSSLKQINRGNVGRLRPAWTYHTGDVSDGKTYAVKSAFEGTPLIVDGVLYLTTSFCRLIALDAETGRELWSFDPKIDRERSHNLFINRGAAYWTDGRRKRIYYGTLEGSLHAIDAATGHPVESFGRAGKLDLRDDVANGVKDPRYSMTSPPSIYKDLVICGSLMSDAEPRGVSGDVRAFDVHTGRMVWRFHVIPHKGETGYETWAEGAAENRAAANAWAPLSVDVERGMVFLPLTSAATNYYGGDRKGANLFSNALVAVDAATGKRIWHYQISRHDLWDYDLPAQPGLVTVKRNGKLVPAVAQVTKQGFAFVFDRLTGKPLFDVEERAMPPSQLEGEEAAPRQPIPLKPAPYARQSMRRDELTDVTPESRAFCAKQLEGATIGTLYTPFSSKPMVLFPGNNGGANYGGASFDPETRTL